MDGMNCSPHNNPANYVDCPDSKRSGYIRTTCKVCGCFVGYRPVEDRPKVIAKKKTSELKLEPVK